MGILTRNLITNLFLAFVISACAGCVPLLLGAGIAANSQGKSVSDVSEVNRKKLNQLSYGISKRFAKDVMGTKRKRALIGEREFIIYNPHREKSITVNGQRYTVLYYVTHANNDSTISNDELTPLVFEGDGLIGWGWDFVKRLRYR